MYQNNAAGAMSFGFTDGSNSDYYCPSDQYGCVHADSAPPGVWVNRTMVFGTPAIAGKTMYIAVLEDNYGPAGNYDVMVADMTITSLDGTITTLLGRGSTSSATSQTYACGAVNAPAGFPISCTVEQVPNSTLAAAIPSTIFTMADHLGSASLEFSQGGWPLSTTQFMPYGAQLNPQGTSDNHYLFTGKERDQESGLDYFGARYYASSMGRWMSPDYSPAEELIWPIPYADLKNPQTLNLYGYVGNNPLKSADPDGHDVKVCDNNGKCNTVSNDAYEAAQKGNNGNLKAPTLDQVGSNGDGKGTFNATAITSTDADGNKTTVGIATYVSNGPTDWYANSAGLTIAGQRGAVMNDPKTYAMWFGASAVGAVGVLYGPAILAATPEAANSFAAFLESRGVPVAAAVAMGLKFGAEKGYYPGPVGAGIAISKSLIAQYEDWKQHQH